METTTPPPPLPPEELRRLVGPVDELYWKNFTGDFFLGDLPVCRSQSELSEMHQRVFDFGCGAGRLAIQMLQQREVPRMYCGVDINRRMIDWCQTNLTAYNNDFTFFHHDVYHVMYGPDNARNFTQPLPAEDGSFSLAIAHSVFTHLLEGQTIHYLSELSRILDVDGLLYTTWFFFTKKAFHPAVMVESQHCLYVSDTDPTQAVFYDWDFFREIARNSGLRIAWVDWTGLPGFHTRVYLTKGTRYPDIAERLVPPSTILGY